ncbi:PREDICTED: zinc finger protein 827 isoform X2 [Myotis davidii]|uniref:zinc finger protein 827 isoform X2 n=1 Tax=Myotis davidii TaxID=225400 RepID=UPI000766FDCA|nr:PREDICTED: zinc finger protein 827 isoform X2 [Myotis davidii]
MPRRKQEQPKRLPSHVSRQDEAEGELSEGEPWYGNSSETPSEASYGEVQENYKLSLEDRIQEQSTSPDTSLGSATPSSHTLELVALDGDVLRDSLQGQDHLSPGLSSLCEDDSPGSTKPLSSNLRRLLEAGSLKLDATATANGRVESPVNVAPNLSFSPPSHHAQQLSVLARKLAEKQEQNDQYTPSNRFIWNQGKWLPNSTTTCGLSPDSAILKLKAAANAVLQDKSLARTEETMRFESFSSPFSSQSASSTLAALSKKVSERSLTPGQEHPPPASSFLSLASMTSSAALLKEVAARAAGSLLAEKSSLVPEDPLPPPPSEKMQEKVTPPPQPPPPPPPPPPQSLELLLLPVPKGRVSKPSNSASEEESGKPFQCPICGLVIKRKSYWKRHMVIHTGLKSHQCPLCPFRCARKDNLKSHMKVHQHQDRGETFQCQLCPFTSSRHFSLKLHMRCHQHFLRTEAKVKEEIPDPDVKGSPHLSDSACLGQHREAGGTELVGTMMPASTPERTSQGGAGVSPLLVKEEPKEDNGLPASFPLNAADRPANHTKLKDPSEYVANSASALFSQDISVKMASDFLMKLSAANQKEPMNLNFQVKEEPQEEEALSASLPRSSYVFSSDSEVSAPSISEDTLKAQEGKGSGLRRDMSVKAASELLMKLSAESYKESQAMKIKEEPMEVDIQDSHVSISPSRNVGYSTLIGREKTEPLQKLPEGRVPPERNLFSQDISVKMASELLFQLSEKVSKEHNHTKENTIRTTTSPFFSEDTFRQSPFSSNSKDLLPGDSALHGRTPAPETEKLVLEAGNGLPSWKFNDQLFPCDVCGKVFGRQQTLSRHLSLHTEERKYKCHLCPYAAKCRANLNQHLTVHSVKLVSTDTEDLVSAVTSEGSDGRKHPYYYSCHVCGFETELNVQFVSHMSLHVDKEQWMFSICCTACDFVTMEEAEIKAHIGTKHTEDRKTPSESNSPSSSSLSALSDSANSKDDSDSSQKNKSGNNLLVISVVPGSQSSLNSEEKPEKGFECVFCNFVCKTKNMFERHLQIHLITRMFECDVCHKFMKTPEQLLEHKKCHTVPTGGLNSGQWCPFCIYSTNRPAAMECHLKTHYKMEYKCRICQTVKANQLELETHTREHRLGNHYKCDQCGYLSKTANKLIEHVRVHTGERPFHCDQCSYSCKRKDNLNLHKKLKHAPRQTFSCEECLFKTTHPFVFSRHVKKHQSGDCPEEDKKGLCPAPKKPAGPGAPLLIVGSSRNLLSPLSVMSASQALQTVALSAVHGSSSEPNLALKALAFNGSPLRFDKYRNSDFAHLIPLTMLYPRNHLDLTFHPPRPQTAPPSIPSPKHSFLAYLGLRERAETV